VAGRGQSGGVTQAVSSPEGGHVMSSARSGWEAACSGGAPEWAPEWVPVEVPGWVPGEVPGGVNDSDG
jgi:hypothetical protein